MFEFELNRNATMIMVVYRGVELGRLSPSKLHTRNGFSKKTKYRLIDADNFGLTRGSKTWKRLRTQGFDSQAQAAEWMKKHYRGKVYLGCTSPAPVE